MNKAFNVVLLCVLAAVVGSAVYYFVHVYPQTRNNGNQNIATIITPPPPDLMTKAPGLPASKPEERVVKNFHRPLPKVTAEKDIQLSALTTHEQELLNLANLDKLVEPKLTMATLSDGKETHKLYFTKEVNTIAEFTFFLRRNFEAQGKDKYFVDYQYSAAAGGVEVQEEEDAVYFIYTLKDNNPKLITGYALFW